MNACNLLRAMVNAHEVTERKRDGLISSQEVASTIDNETQSVKSRFLPNGFQ